MDELKSIEKGNDILRKYTLSYPEINEIKKVKDRIIQEDIQADELSHLLTKMSALIFRIGVLSAEVSNKANESYIYRKLKYMWEYNRLGDDIKVGKKESQAMEMVKKEYEQELVNRFVADYIQNLYKDYDRLISVLQSKLALLRSEMYKLQ